MVYLLSYLFFGSVLFCQCMFCSSVFLLWFGLKIVLFSIVVSPLPYKAAHGSFGCSVLGYSFGI